MKSPRNDVCIMLVYIMLITQVVYSFDLKNVKLQYFRSVISVMSITYRLSCDDDRVCSTAGQLLVPCLCLVV